MKESAFTRLTILIAAMAVVSLPAGGSIADTATEPPPGHWLSAVQQRIAEQEYQVTWQDRTCLSDVEAAWHAPNRAHDFRTYFTGEGIRVVPRTESEPSWEWGLALVGYGRGPLVWPVDEASLRPAENRIEYDRGAIAEWYVNAPRGLEQGLTLFARPDDGGLDSAATAIAPSGTRNSPLSEEERDRAVYVELGLSGTLNPSFSTDGQAIDFATGRGVNVVHYSELKVTDASGRELPSWMEGFAQAGVRGIRLVFDDSGAAYPVTIDPLATSSSWNGQGNQADANLGISVATAGDVNSDGYTDVVVGAQNYDNGQTDEGRAFVYHGSASGLSSVEAWSAESDQASAQFGISVATAGDVNGDGYADVIVGANYYDNGQNEEGRAYVYHGSSSGLPGVFDGTAVRAGPGDENWSAESDQLAAQFGISVATAGDVDGDGYSDIIVGANYYDNGEANEGRAFVYHGSAAGLSAAADWTAESDQLAAWFGISVATAGDVDGDGYSDVIIGANYYDNVESNEGRAYVYHGSAAGLSTVEDWTAEGDQSGAWFGYSVATAGDVNGDGYADVIVGANRYDNALSSEGRAYVYHGSAAGLSAVEDWTAESDQAGAEFGISVATAGDVDGDGYADVIVGANLYDNGDTDEGRAYVYHGSAAGLSAVEDWTAESNQAGSEYGISVGTAGDVNGDGYADVIVGAHFHDAGETDEGVAYVYHGSPAGLSAVEGWTAESDHASASFGYSVGTAGDVNGDGYADVIVGAHGYDNGDTNEGRAYVYHGSAAGLSVVESWAAEGNQTTARFGYSVGTAGDVNDDGYADVIVGANYYDSGQTDEGRAYVYHGSVTGLSAAEAWTAESDQDIAHFGHSVGAAGDVNGDGYADVIVGAADYGNGESREGRAYVYHGSATGLSTVEDWTAESDQGFAHFGFSVGTAGDVNGDGYADVIVGAYEYNNVHSDEGRAYVYHGSAAGLSAVEAWTENGAQDSEWFGHSVGTAGDVNGDGYADVIVGANRYDIALGSEGRAFVYHGSAAGLSTVEDWMAEGDLESAEFGFSVATAGDVNGDGYADVIVGAVYYSNDEASEGRAYVYHGSAAGLSATEGWIAEGDQTLALFGRSVGTAGDVNGDGYGDVIVGADYYDNGHNDEGRAFVYYGNGGPGPSLRPQQRRADDLAPIADGGRSRESGSFRLAALGRTPFGRGRVKLEWEVKPLGQPFDGTGTGRRAWTDTGTLGTAINELVSGLEPGAQHWRLRLAYDPATIPFASASRWLTVPWNGWEERDLTLSPFVGGKVWDDRDGDGIMGSDEPFMGGVLVHLIDGVGTTLQTAVTTSDGSYRFEMGAGDSQKVRFEAPQDWAFTLQDQGTDDMIDSDADTATGETAPMVPPFDSTDENRLSAGLRRLGPCFTPDEPIYIYGVRLSTDGNDYPILDFQDPNQPEAVTGYNVYRSSEAGLPPEDWPRVASDVVDMDESEPNKQWVDTSGDVSPTGTWYYEVTAYNHACDAEGPR